MDRERRRESTTEEENRRSSARDRTLSCQPPLWTVINFSIRESHELSGLKGTHNSEKMESLFSVASFVCETLLFFCPHFSALRLPRRAPLLSSPVATTARFRPTSSHFSSHALLAMCLPPFGGPAAHPCSASG